MVCRTESEFPKETLSSNGALASARDDLSLEAGASRNCERDVLSFATCASPAVGRSKELSAADVLAIEGELSAADEAVSTNEKLAEALCAGNAALSGELGGEICPEDARDE